MSGIQEHKERRAACKLEHARSVEEREEQREMSRRAKLKAQFGIAPQDAWGKLIGCSRNCIFYDNDPR